MTQKRILFSHIKGVSDGGSDYSLYMHLSNLDQKKYKPFLLFQKKSRLVVLLESIGVELIQYPFKVKENKKVDKKIVEKASGRKTAKVSTLRSILSSIKILLKTLPQTTRFISIIRKNRIELVHTNHNLDDDRAVLIASVLLRKRIVSHYRGLYNPVLLDKIVSYFIDYIICVSEFSKQVYIKYGIPSKKCTVIYNGVDVNSFEPSSAKIDTKLIGCIGRLVEWKGQRVLIEAAKIIIKKIPELKIEFLGEGAEKEKLQKMITDYNLENSIFLRGAVSDVKEYMKNYDIVIHTSIEPEPFGRVIIESMSMNKPVIATKIGGPLEIISNNIDGVLIEPNNPVLLANKIIELILDKDRRIKISENAREKVQSNFTLSNTTEKIVNIYKQLLPELI